MDVKYRNTKFNVEPEFNEEIFNSMINGDKVTVNGRKRDENVFEVYLNGKKRNIYVADDDKRFYVSVEGREYTFDKLEEEEAKFESAAADTDKEEIMTPMPGSIVKVLVEEGQKVAEGDALIIVEAMKMETTLYSSMDGIVSEVNVKAGEQVSSDTVLVLVKKEET